MMDDPIGRMRADMDQAAAGLREFAGSLWIFYSELCEQGFKRDQALALTCQLLANTAPSGDAPEGDE